MNALRAGTPVRYKLRPEYGLGRVQWVTADRYMVRFVDAKPMFEDFFSVDELEEAVEAHA